MSLRVEIREETNLEVVLPVRWRSLYPGMEFDVEVSRETDLAVGTMHLVAVPS